MAFSPSRAEPMAFFRTVSFAEPLPAMASGVVLRAPQMADFAEWAALREASRDFLTPVGADLAGRRPHAAARSAAASSAMPRTSAATRPMPFFIFRKRRQCAGRRAHARQHPPRRRAGRQPRLLDGRALCPPGLHDGGGAGAHAVRVRHAAAAPARGRLHPDQCRLDPAAGEDAAFEREGYARQYLCINGIWQDHLLLCAAQGRPGVLTSRRLPAPWGRHGCAAINAATSRLRWSGNADLSVRGVLGSDVARDRGRSARCDRVRRFVARCSGGVHRARPAAVARRRRLRPRSARAPAPAHGSRRRPTPLADRMIRLPGVDSPHGRGDAVMIGGQDRPGDAADGSALSGHLRAARARMHAASAAT